VVVDAHLEPELIVQQARERGCTVRAILLTHTDVDHVAGLPRLLQEWPGLPVAVHDEEREVVAGGRPLRRSFPVEQPAVERVERLAEGEVYRAGTLEFEVLHTPGHSPGGVTLKIGGLLLTGDALFAGSVGRSDFENSDGALLLESIRAKLLTQPDEMVVLSGHGPASTIGQERRYNPFL
jgi:glyoxylase-like metal-dependent hydrolase (beta-lactamase superfamily II)